MGQNGSKKMKKVLLILVAAFALSLSANAIVLRGTHKVCGNGAELTLYSSGRMVFWNDSHSYEGSYTIKDGYLLLLDENGKQIYACKYEYNSNTGKLLWVNVGGVTFRKC